MTTLIDGRATDALPADDLALGSGLAVFEALRTYDRRPFRFAEHHARLAASAAWFGLDCPAADLLAAELAAGAEAVVGEVVLLVTLTGSGRRIVRALPLDAARVNAPLRVATIAFEPPPWLPGWVKHTSRAGWLLAARRAEVDEVLFVGADGAWAEANRSNVFAVRDGVLLTPPADGRILAGVTRGALLEAARAIGIPTRETRILPGPVDELYLASTLKELAPVVELEGQPLPGWGPLGRALHAAFQRT